jgi:hypothetical protein
MASLFLVRRQPRVSERPARNQEENPCRGETRAGRSETRTDLTPVEFAGQYSAMATRGAIPFAFPRVAIYQGHGGASRGVALRGRAGQREAGRGKAIQGPFGA